MLSGIEIFIFFVSDHLKIHFYDLSYISTFNLCAATSEEC